VAYYLGIDGGGSKTTCAVGDESSLLATVTAGPSNITRVGEARAREALQQAIREACAAAQIDPRQVRRACVGVAGAGREEVASTVRNIVAEIIPGEIEVVGDMAIAMASAFGVGPGVIVIAGTGSIACARNARGETSRAGGWGYAISDEGSAHWIGRSMIQALLQTVDNAASDGTPAHHAAESLPLFRELKAVWCVSSLDEFVRKANSNPDFAELFPAIMAAGDRGDEVAQRVLTMAGGLLAGFVRIVCQIFRRDKPEMSAIPLAMAGGVFRHSPRTREIFKEDVRKFDPRIEVKQEIVDPVNGALQMARAADRNAEVESI
jgi:glucosamine kinase